MENALPAESGIGVGGRTRSSHFVDTTPFPLDMLLDEWKIRREARISVGDVPRRLDCRCELPEYPHSVTFPYPVPQNCEVLSAVLALFCDQEYCTERAVIRMHVDLVYDLIQIGIDIDGLTERFEHNKEAMTPIHLCIKHFKHNWSEACWDCAKLFEPPKRRVTKQDRWSQTPHTIKVEMVDHGTQTQ